MSKKLIYPLGLVLAVFIAFFVYQKYRVAPELKLKTLHLVDLNGETVLLESFKGKKMVLCFSASWCGNCIEELNTINALNKADLAGVEIIVISDEPLEKIKAFKEKRGYPFTFLKLTTGFNEIGIYSIPTSYIINKNLEVKKETVGYLNWEDPSTLQHLKMLME